MESYLFHLWEQRFLCPHSSIRMVQRHENKSFSDILVPNDPHHMAIAPCSISNCLMLQTVPYTQYPWKPINWLLYENHLTSTFHTFKLAAQILLFSNSFQDRNI